MLQGWLASLLLVFAALLSQPAFASKEMTQQEVNQWISNPIVQQKVTEYMDLVMKDDIDGLKFALNRLALPQQEVARYVLLQEIEQRSIILTPKMAIFVKSQKSLPTTYTMLERGDSYEFSIPAFNYPAISARLIKSWNSDQKLWSSYYKSSEKSLFCETGYLKGRITIDKFVKIYWFVSLIVCHQKPTPI